MINKTFYNIFQQGSRTYFYSSMFFPSYLKKDVFVLYGFVRKADNFVDAVPQQINQFYEFKEKYYRAVNGNPANDIVIDSFVDLMQKKEFDPKWADAFLSSMEMDITKKRYDSLDETLTYIYGSAEVIGLMMAKLMNLPPNAMPYARYLGRAMQYINFIRDVTEDVQLGRVYFPTPDIENHGLASLEYEYTSKYPEAFASFIHSQLERYCKWQTYAEQGYPYIPKRYLISIKTASEMYHWTGIQIYHNPYIVYQKKVKPMISKIVATTLLNVIDPQKTTHTLPQCVGKRAQPAPQINY